MNNTQDMTKGNATRLIVMFALPLIFGNIFQQLYTVADAAIVGKGVGLQAFAAIGTVDWLLWLFFGTIQGCTQGFSASLSQVFGAKDIKRLKNMRAMSELIAIVMTIVIVAIGLLGLPLFLRLLNVPEELMENSALYFRIIVLGLPCFMFYNLYASILRAVGNSQIPLIGIIVSSLANIVLDSVAVFILGWGLVGAAVATVFSQLLAGLICFVAVLKTRALQYEKEDIYISRENIAILLGIGLPTAFQNIVISIGGVIMQSVVNTFGTVFIAGFTAGSRLYGILEIAALSFGLSVLTYVGQNYGAGEIGRIKTGMRSAVKISIGIAVGLGVVVIIFSRQLTGMFISAEDPVIVNEAVRVGSIYLSAMGAGLTILYMIYIYRFALQGLGIVRPSVVSAGAELAARIVFSVLAYYTGHSMFVIGAEMAAWVVGAGVVMVAYFRSMKKVFNGV